MKYANDGRHNTFYYQWNCTVMVRIVPEQTVEKLTLAAMHYIDDGHDEECDQDGSNPSQFLFV
jgi:hypothetical protein